MAASVPATESSDCHASQQRSLLALQLELCGHGVEGAAVTEPVDLVVVEGVVDLAGA